VQRAQGQDRERRDRIGEEIHRGEQLVINIYRY